MFELTDNNSIEQAYEPVVDILNVFVILVALTMPATKQQNHVAVAANGDKNYNSKTKEIYTICVPGGNATNEHSKHPSRGW